MIIEKIPTSNNTRIVKDYNFSLPGVVFKLQQKKWWGWKTISSTTTKNRLPDATIEKMLNEP